MSFMSLESKSEGFLKPFELYSQSECEYYLTDSDSNLQVKTGNLCRAWSTLACVCVLVCVTARACSCACQRK